MSWLSKNVGSLSNLASRIAAGNPINFTLLHFTPPFPFAKGATLIRENKTYPTISNTRVTRCAFQLCSCIDLLSFLSLLSLTQTCLRLLAISISYLETNGEHGSNEGILQLQQEVMNATQDWILQQKNHSEKMTNAKIIGFRRY